jgi:hypothetical protein
MTTEVFLSSSSLPYLKPWTCTVFIRLEQNNKMIFKAYMLIYNTKAVKNPNLKSGLISYNQIMKKKKHNKNITKQKQNHTKIKTRNRKCFRPVSLIIEFPVITYLFVAINGTNETNFVHFLTKFSLNLFN